ncbi:MAG: phosphatase PAP2 family protein [Burkholderiales bacterium]|nr:phosphatase PAP2 family protein [Burkholderiales bacterium]
MNFEAIDRSATAFMNGLSGHLPALDSFMVAVTSYGAYVMIAAVAVRWWWNHPYDKLHERHLAIRCGLSVILGLLVNQVILLFVHRLRPYDAGVTHLLISHSADPSFPSDHATLAFAIAFAYLGTKARRGWGLLLAALMLAISRVYVGTHYVFDIVGGAYVGWLGAGLARLTYREGTRLDRWATRIL